MSSKTSNYSIVKVTGLSMNPFFKTNDILLISKVMINEVNDVGSCFLVDGKIHRLIETNIFKGDRLIYRDELLTPPEAIVLGKIIEKNKKIYLTMHSVPILFFISKMIAQLSHFNVEKNILRPLILLLIISLGATHRFLELFFLKEFKS